MPSARFVWAAVVLALLPSGRARACSDSGTPVICAHPSPFDAGPGCSAPRDSCGCYDFIWCTDAGHDAGPQICSPFVDAGVDGPSGLRHLCSATSDCTRYHPELTCGDDGFCACAGDSSDAGAPTDPLDAGMSADADTDPTPAASCRISPGASSTSPFALLGLALLVGVTRIRRPRGTPRRTG